MIFLQLFWEFFKIGLFAVGGGIATVPFLEDISAKTGWYSLNQLADMIAIAESTPGPLGINAASYVGYTVGLTQGGWQWGVLGAAVSTVGIIMPAITIVLLIASFLDRFRENAYVKGVFYTLRPASVALVAAAGVTIVCISFFNVGDILKIFSQFSLQYRDIVLAAILWVATRYIPKVKDLHAIVFIVFSAIVGVVFNFSGAV